MAVLFTPPFMQFLDASGSPLNGGKVYTYAAGTTTPKATFTTQAGDVEQTNPVILDSAGRTQMWIEGSYKFVVKDSLDVTIETTDNVTAFTATAAASTAFFQTFSGDASTTSFVLSSDLGTDEKAIMVWVDAGGSKGYDLQNVSDYTVSGTSLVFSTAPATGTNNIYVSAPSQLIGAAASSAAAADTSATNAATSATNAATSETNAAASAASAAVNATAEGTSTTSLAIATGSKVFTTQSGKFFVAGNWLLITSDADPTNYMHGQVTTYSGTTLTMNITNIGGSGTLADWTIRVSGTRGATGATGAQGATGNIGDINAQTSAVITAIDEIVFGDVSDSNNTKKDTVQGILDLATGGLTLLATATASASATVDFTSFIDSTYDEYIIECISVVPGTDSVSLQIRTSTDGGSTFDSGGTDYQYVFIAAIASSASVTVGKSTGASAIKVGGHILTVGNAAGESLNATIRLKHPSNTSTNTSMLIHAGFNNSNEAVNVGSATRKSAADVDAVRFLMSSGNITSGEFKLYGVQKS